MKKAVLMSFVILLLSVVVAFAQSNQAATSSNDDKAKVESASKAQNAQQYQTVQRYRHDAKGGIIVPHASKGFKQTRLTPEQQRTLNRILEASKNKIVRRDAKKALPASRDMNTSRNREE